MANWSPAPGADFCASPLTCAVDAEVDLLADGLYVFRSLQRLRSDLWLSPTDVLDRRLDVPYPELIAMARSFADRTEGDEQTELLHLADRLAVARDGRGAVLPEKTTEDKQDG